MAANLYTETEFRVEFYDVDSMFVAWHGNYVKYMELGRCALLDDIGYGYREMSESGYLWPVVDMKIKYVKPLRLGQKAVIRAELLEYENRIKIKFLIRDALTGEKMTVGESTQMAVDMESRESCFVSPPCLISLVEAKLEERA